MHFYEPKLGNYIEQFINETDDGLHIEEFVSAGPINYANLNKNEIKKF